MSNVSPHGHGLNRPAGSRDATSGGGCGFIASRFECRRTVSPFPFVEGRARIQCGPQENLSGVPVAAALPGLLNAKITGAEREVLCSSRWWRRIFRQHPVCRPVFMKAAGAVNEPPRVRVAACENIIEDGIE
jgi:hypothetical protein